MQAKAMGRLFRLKAKAAGAESDFALCRRAENPQDFFADPALCFLVYYLFYQFVFHGSVLPGDWRDVTLV